MIDTACQAAKGQPDFTHLARQSVAEAEALKPQEELVAEHVKAAAARIRATAAYDEQYYQHQQWILRYTRCVYYWHFLSTTIVFLLVVGIVAFGLRLSYLQFKKDMVLSRVRRELGAGIDGAGAGADKQSAVTPPPPTLQTLKLGLQGIEISSSVIGLLIFTLSLGFFYLYLEQVYPIRTEATAQEKNNPTKPNTKTPSEK